MSFEKGNKLWDNEESKKTLFKRGNPPWNKGRKETRKNVLKKQSISHRGKKQTEELIRKRIKSKDKHWNWQGGKSFEPYSVDWTKTLRRSIRERDHYICFICKSQQGDETFNVHHIDYDKTNCNPINLITLCKSCHMKTNYNREYWTNYFNKSYANPS